MEIIDAQIHEATPAAPWSPCLTDDQSAAAGAELAIAAMDAVGVRAAVVNSLLPTVSAYLARHPDRFGGLPHAGPQLPLQTSVDEFVAELRGTPGIVGIRLVIAHPKDASRVEQLRNGAYEPFFAAAEAHRLPVFVLLHGSLRELHHVVRAHPELVVVVDHLGLFHPPWRSGPEIFDDIPEVLQLAQFPNVALKLTGAPALSERAYPFADLWPHLHTILDGFGVGRLMWGSDFTRCRGHHSYREAVDFLLHTDELSSADKEALFAGSIRKWLGWPVPGGAQP